MGKSTIPKLAYYFLLVMVVSAQRTQAALVSVGIVTGAVVTFSAVLGIITKYKIKKNRERRRKGLPPHVINTSGNNQVYHSNRRFCYVDDGSLHWRGENASHTMLSIC